MRTSTLAMVAVALLASACAVDERSGEFDSGTWDVHHNQEGGALLSVWGSSSKDVWAVGGTADRGIVLHFDGYHWNPVETGAGALLWWVYGFGPSDVYAVGEHGLLLHFDGETWQQLESGTDRALYGVWGASGQDVWIVGGDPSEPGAAVVLRGTASTAFARVTDLPPSLMPRALFKAYGYAADDVVIVGAEGTILRWNGDTWQREPNPTDQPIFSLSGRASDDVYAVGGRGAGSILHFGGDGWTEVDDAAGTGLSGVFTAPSRPTIAVGPLGYVLEIQADGTQIEPQLPSLAPNTSLHGVWGDEEGTTYAVGGDLFSYPAPTRGVILRRR